VSTEEFDILSLHLKRQYEAFTAWFSTLKKFPTLNEERICWHAFRAGQLAVVEGETQKSISDWADATFGVPQSNLRIALRMQEEMVELLKRLCVNDADPGAAEEVADIFIVAARLMERLGTDLTAMVDAKMRVNRERRWVLDGTGCGQHTT
jgi:Protein of unknown function (DUF550)